MLNIEFFVKGNPYPFQRPRKGKYGNFFNDPTYSDWKNLVRVQTQRAMTGMALRSEIPPPYEVSTEFYLSKPKKPLHYWPSKFDLDNCLKGILDSIQSNKKKGILGIITDDRHVIRFGRCFKKFANHQTGVLIKVRHIPPDDI